MCSSARAERGRGRLRSRMQFWRVHSVSKLSKTATKANIAQLVTPDPLMAAAWHDAPTSESADDVRPLRKKANARTSASADDLRPLCKKANALTSASADELQSFAACARIVEIRKKTPLAEDKAGPERDLSMLAHGICALGVIRQSEAQEVLEHISVVAQREPVRALEMLLASEGIDELPFFGAAEIHTYSIAVYQRASSTSKDGHWMSDASCVLPASMRPAKLAGSTTAAAAAAAAAHAATPSKGEVIHDGRILRRCLYGGAKQPSTAEVRRAGALALLRALSLGAGGGPGEGLVPPLSDVAAATRELRLSRAAVYRMRGFGREEREVMNALKMESTAAAERARQQGPGGRQQQPGDSAQIERAETLRLDAHVMDSQRMARKKRIASLAATAHGPRPAEAATPDGPPPPPPIPELDGWLMAAVHPTLSRPAVPIHNLAALERAGKAATRPPPRRRAGARAREREFCWRKVAERVTEPIDWQMKLTTPFQAPRSRRELEKSMRRAEAHLLFWQHEHLAAARNGKSSDSADDCWTGGSLLDA